MEAGAELAAPSGGAIPHLYQVKGRGKRVEVREVSPPLRRDSLNSGDVFVLSDGQGGGNGRTWQWNGTASNADERLKGAKVAASMATGHDGNALGASGGVVVLDEGETDGEADHPLFWALLPRNAAAAAAAAAIEPGRAAAVAPAPAAAAADAEGGVLSAAAGGDDDDVGFHVPVLWRWAGVELGLVRQGFASASFTGPVAPPPFDSDMKFKRAELRRDEVSMREDEEKGVLRCASSLVYRRFVGERERGCVLAPLSLEELWVPV
jgi:hypothetical protein